MNITLTKTTAAPLHSALKRVTVLAALVAVAGVGIGCHWFTAADALGQVLQGLMAVLLAGTVSK